MENVKVAVRVRPFNRRELELNQQSVVEICDLNKICLRNYQKAITKTFQFDHCFDSTNESSPLATQEKVYECLGLDALDNLISGYNACIFAYGQTGSGKSYTIMGSGNGGGDSATKGIIPRLCEDLFKRLDEETRTKAEQQLTFKTEVSYMEIYNEKVKDLLDTKEGGSQSSNHHLKVREHQLLGIYVDGLTQLAVKSYEDIEIILNEGNKLRTVAATNMNAESSRSHAVFCIKIIQSLYDKQTNMNGEKVSKLSIIDLAGSEKVSKTGTEGDRLKEGCNINRSLHTLGQVISALADNSSSPSSSSQSTNNRKQLKHIPYRDSTLTWLLKDSLGGNSKTIMISTISPSMDNYEETLSTLRYSDRAKCIVNNAVINEDPNAKIIRNLREEVEMLRKELDRAKEKLSMDSLTDRLHESEKLYEAMAKPWEKKLAETDEWREKLHTMGISVQSSGIRVENDKYFLVNLSPSSQSSSGEYLVYYLNNEITRIGRTDAAIKQDIQLNGPGVAHEHCVLTLKNNQVFIASCNEANNKILVNNEPIRAAEQRCLFNGDRISIGLNSFRLNCPIVNHRSESTHNLSDSSSSSSQYFRALSIAPYFGSSTTTATTTTMTTTSSLDENEEELDDDQFESSSNCLSPPLLNRHDSSLIGSVENINLRLLEKLRDQLLNANRMVNEANDLLGQSSSLASAFRFEVTLNIPQMNLTSCNSRRGVLAEPAIRVKKRDNNDGDAEQEEMILEMEAFEKSIVSLKSASAAAPPPTNPYKVFNFESNNEFVGVCTLFLDSLIYFVSLDDAKKSEKSVIKYEHDLSILSSLGEIVGKLRVRVEMTSSSVDNKNSIRFRLTIVEINDLMIMMSHRRRIDNIFCKYRFLNKGDLTILPTQVRSESTSSPIRLIFNHSMDFFIDSNDICECSLPIALFSNKHVTLEQPQSLLFVDSRFFNTANQMRRARLVGSWSEISKSFDLSVAIDELSKEGIWRAVEVKQHGYNKTGGVYQLRHGQSRQISVRIGATSKSSVMYQNGCQFDYDPVSIDKLTIGSVHAVELAASDADFDSYQAHDLAKLKERCRLAFDKRKQYLRSELDRVGDNDDDDDNDDDEKRESYLINELATVGEEQMTMDAPEADSNLPGAAVSWRPPGGVEQHVPILFLDIMTDNTNNEESLMTSSSSSMMICSNNELGDDFDNNNNNVESDYYSGRKRVVTSRQQHQCKTTLCEDSVLENEIAKSFLELDLLKKSDNDTLNDYLEAKGNWDATRHQSIHLNQTTPSDKQIFLILKVYVRFRRRGVIELKQQQHQQDSVNKYITVVMRKRIAVNIYIPSLIASTTSMGLVSFKRLFSSSSSSNDDTSPQATGANQTVPNTNQTGITYRLIAQIPARLKELERRDKLAHQVAKRLLKENYPSSSSSSSSSMIDPIDAFIRYLESSVGVSLRRERVEQMLKLKSSLGNKLDLNGLCLLLKQKEVEMNNDAIFRKKSIENQNELESTMTTTTTNNQQIDDVNAINSETRTTMMNHQLEEEEACGQEEVREMLISSSEEDESLSSESLGKKEAESSETDGCLRIGARVIVAISAVGAKQGHIRFIGQTDFAQGVWIGVELADSCGKNDGSLNGRRYFKCEPNRGVFVKPDKLKLDNNN